MGLGNLPEDVLCRIFSFLRVPWLRPLRCVSRSFKKASLQYITGLRLADLNESSAINAISDFQGIASMTLLDGLPPSSEAWPLSVNKLRSLMVYNPSNAAASRLASLLPYLSDLTSLKLLDTDEWIVHDNACNLQGIFASCTALRALEVKLYRTQRDPSHFPGILGLTALQELTPVEPLVTTAIAC